MISDHSYSPGLNLLLNLTSTLQAATNSYTSVWKKILLHWFNRIQCADWWTWLYHRYISGHCCIITNASPFSGSYYWGTVTLRFSPSSPLSPLVLYYTYSVCVENKHIGICDVLPTQQSVWSWTSPRGHSNSQKLCESLGHVLCLLRWPLLHGCSVIGLHVVQLLHILGDTRNTFKNTYSKMFSYITWSECYIKVIVYWNQTSDLSMNQTIFKTTGKVKHWHTHYY